MIWLLIVLLVLVAIAIYSVWDVQEHKPIDRFSMVSPGVWRSHQPESIAEYDLLKDAGIKTVINLREESFAEKERPIVENMGMKFYNFAWSGVAIPSSDEVNQALEIIDAPNCQPVLVHCTYGKDRTGMMIGMYRRLKGWTKIAAWKEMWHFGFNPINIGLFIYYWTH